MLTESYAACVKLNKNMDKPEIKACPACGKPARVSKQWSPRYNKAFYSVGCETDKCLGNLHHRPCIADESGAVSRWNEGAGDREPAVAKTPKPSTLASANGSDALVRNAILAYELLEKVKQILHATDEVAEDGCRLAATVMVNLERGTLKDDEHGTLRTLAHHVLRQDPKHQNDQAQPPRTERVKQPEP